MTAVKKTDLYKNLGLKINDRLQKSSAPDRFAQASDKVLDKKAQRELDRERGLVPFATKLPAQLVSRLQAEAESRQSSMADLVEALLTQALAGEQ